MPREEKLVENAEQMGDYLIDQLSEIPSRHVKEVRGKGLLVGVELKPQAGGARRFCEALKQTRHPGERNAPAGDPFCTALIVDRRLSTGR